MFYGKSCQKVMSSFISNLCKFILNVTTILINRLTARKNDFNEELKSYIPSRTIQEGFPN